MRRPNFAAVVCSALVTVLLTVQLVEAKCAWVLWEHQQIRDSLTRYVHVYLPLSAYETRDGCAHQVDTLLRDGGKIKNGARHSVVCLPDSIDPRGPVAAR